MNTSQDDFSPMSIDQQIDLPDELLSREDALLIHGVRAMFEQEKNMSIEQGWARIVSQRASRDQQSEVLDLSQYRQRNERISIMNEHILPSTPIQAVPKKRSVLRLFSLVAAVLVCVALVGSLTLVLGASRNKTPSTQVGSGNTTQKATPTATPLVIPAACKDSANPGEEKLCAEGKETSLNITKSVTVHTHDQYGKVTGSATLNLTFLRAYADSSHLLLVYMINQAPAQVLGNDWGGYGTLTTDQGDLRANSPCMAQGLCVESFDTSSLPTGIKQLQAQALTTDFGDSLPLAFTLPVQTATSKTVTVNQTVTKNGYTLTLNQLVLTDSTTTLAYAYTPQPAGVHAVYGEVQAITINGQSQAIGSSASGSGSGNSAGGSWTTVLNQTLLDQPGTWTVTMALTGLGTQGQETLMTATFTFTVSA
jgi:hypothetical protein